MSPRKHNMITVEAWSKMRTGRLYKGMIKKAHIEKASNCLHVTIENLDPAQLGRIHEMDLPLPVRPGNRTSLFLVACGIDAATAGTTICLDQVTDVIVGMRCRSPDASGSEDFDFEQIPDAPANAEALAKGSREQTKCDSD